MNNSEINKLISLLVSMEVYKFKLFQSSKVEFTLQVSASDIEKAILISSDIEDALYIQLKVVDDTVNVVGEKVYET